MGHEPAFKANHTDCLDDFPAARDVFWNILSNAACRVYFCGHDHFYDHMRLDDQDGDPSNDIHQMIIGLGGRSLSHYLRLRWREQHLDPHTGAPRHDERLCRGGD